jgi:hypothetical protein
MRQSIACAGFDCVGSGGDIARFCVKWLFPDFTETNIPRHVAEPLASQIIAQAIAFDPEVGGGFEVRGIPKPGAEYATWPSQAATPMASEFRQFADSIRRVVVGCLDVKVDDGELKIRLDNLAEQAMVLKNVDIELNRQMQEARNKNIQNKILRPRRSASRKSQRGR